MIIGVDWGGANVKLCASNIVHSFPSDIIPHKTIQVENDLRMYDFIFEYRGRKGFAGTLARDERTSLDGNRRGDSKFHEDALIRLLISIHQFSPVTTVRVVVGQPIGKHSEEKDAIRDMLVKRHTITVNGVTKAIVIEDAAVGAEGAVAFFSHPRPGRVHIVDIGSGTINMATLQDGRFLNNYSTTIPRGLDNTDYNLRTIAEAIRNRMIDLEWGNEVFLAGGGASIVQPYLSSLVSCRLLTAVFNNQLLGPEYTNAVGLYKVGERLWQN